MDERHLEKDLRVVVYIGAIAAEMNDNPKVCTTGTVLGPAGDGLWWIKIEVPAGGTLEQMYRPEEILGLGTWLTVL